MIITGFQQTMIDTWFVLWKLLQDFTCLH